MQIKTVKLRSGRLGKYRPGHPWIYKKHLLKVDPSIKPGSIVGVIAPDGKKIGTGYYNSHSDISVRILTFVDEPVDKAFFISRIAAAAAKRSGLAKLTDAYRAVFSEADGLPGLIIDMYGETAVFQVLTLGMERFKETIVECIDEALKAKYIYERSDSLYRKEEGLEERQGWWGEEGAPCVEIREGRAVFLVDIVSGHKTGFYLDQRSSRFAVEAISKGKEVLDLFCYTGGFAVHAALGGAKSVLCADIKEDWLILGRRNAELSGVSAKVEFIKANSFEFLKNIYNSSRVFDIIIVDPPSFAKAKHSVAGASKGYEELNLTAMRCLRPGGVLATFSCSHSMTNEIFSGILKKAAAKAVKKITILKRCHQAEDHPIVRAIPETEYLKGYFLKLDPQ
jgi:23S rRNA (cytosine1962-C5)-methyltransferase